MKQKYLKVDLVKDFSDIQFRLFLDDVKIPEKDKQKIITKITEIFEIINLDK
jgi:hypothetical protein